MTANVSWIYVYYNLDTTRQKNDDQNVIVCTQILLRYVNDALCAKIEIQIQKKWLENWKMITFERVRQLIPKLTQIFRIINAHFL